MTFLGRLFTTVLAATLIGPFTNSALARDIADKPPLTRGAIKDNLIIAATERDDYVKEILAKHLKNEEPGSGLIVIGASEEHEVISARKFSRLLKEKLNLRVVLVSSWGTTSVPAYDGIVIDRNNDIVANFSMKKVSAASTERLWSAASRAFEKIRRFQNIDEWMAFILNQFDWRTSSGKIAVDSQRQAELLYRLYHDAADDISIFKVGSHRPNWVFIDSVSDYPLDDAMIQDFEPHIPTFIKKDAEKAIILHTEGHFYTYSGGRSCEDDLSSKKTKH